MMNQLLRGVVSAAAVVAGLGWGGALAGGAGPSPFCDAIAPNLYELQVVGVGLCTNAACTTIAPLTAGGASTVDAGSDNAPPNTDIATLPGGVDVPSGTYTHLRIELGSTINMAGGTNVGPGFCRTPAGTATNGHITGTDLDVPASPATTIFTLADGTVVNFGGGAILTVAGNRIVIVIPLTVPLVVDGEQVPQPIIAVNVDRALVVRYSSRNQPEFRSLSQSLPECGLAVAIPSLTVIFNGQTTELTSIDETAICNEIDNLFPGPV